MTVFHRVDVIHILIHKGRDTCGNLIRGLKSVKYAPSL